MLQSEHDAQAAGASRRTEDMTNRSRGGRNVGGGDPDGRSGRPPPGARRAPRPRHHARGRRSDPDGMSRTRCTWSPTGRATSRTAPPRWTLLVAAGAESTPGSAAARRDAAALGGQQRRRRGPDALLDAGADIEAADGSIGTPLANAVGYGCWNVAGLLLARGARVDEPWHASALGLVDRLAELLGDDPGPEVVSQAFWHACAGAQRRAAEYLLARGADLSWVPGYAHGTPLDAARGPGNRRENVISSLSDLGARSSQP